MVTKVIWGLDLYAVRHGKCPRVAQPAGQSLFRLIRPFLLVRSGEESWAIRMLRTVLRCVIVVRLLIGEPSAGGTERPTADIITP
jgi:hypothetical protein